MEPTKTQMTIPYDGWGFEGGKLWIRIGQAAFHIPFEYTGPIHAPRLILEIYHAQSEGPPIK